MKLIIAGSRTLNEDLGYLLSQRFSAIQSLNIDEVVSGGARGIDQAGEIWAKQNNIPTRVFPPDWVNYGKAAGPIRNEQMAQYADALLLVWDGRSRGSKNMKEQMQKLNKPVFEIVLYKDPHASEEEE